MKKIYFILVFIFLIPFTQANYSSDSGYKTIDDNNLNFQAILEDWSVQTSWNSFTKSWEYWFSYYKVIRSQTKSNPYYPEDGYISYISDIENTNYTDNKPFSWWAYYRVCAIAFDKWNYRFCSKVVYVVNNKKSDDKNTYQEKESKNTTIKNTLNVDTKTKLNNLFKKYQIKIESKTTNNEERLKIVNTIIEKLNTLKSSEVLNYILEKFNDYKNELSLDISNIDDIINNIIK